MTTTQYHSRKCPMILSVAILPLCVLWMAGVVFVALVMAIFAPFFPVNQNVK